MLRAMPARISSFESPQTKNKSHLKVAFIFGGPEEIRTPDPYNANVMRSQLRYRPIGFASKIIDPFPLFVKYPTVLTFSLFRSIT